MDCAATNRQIKVGTAPVMSPDLCGPARAGFRTDAELFPDRQRRMESIVNGMIKKQDTSSFRAFF
jgi:hypothetical protein